MKIIYVILISLSVVLNGCTPPVFITGKYTGKNPHVLAFFEDSTFEYEYHGVWYSESSGTWQRRGNMIYLNSFEQRDKIPIEYMKTKNNQQKIIVKVKVCSQDKPESEYICLAYINGKRFFGDNVSMDSLPIDSFSIDFLRRGSYSFDTKVSIDSLYFWVVKRPAFLRGTRYKMSYDDIRTPTIYPSLSVGESLEVRLNIIDSLFGCQVLKNEKAEVKNNKIIFHSRGRKNKLYLKK